MWKLNGGKIFCQICLGPHANRDNVVSTNNPFLLLTCSYKRDGDMEL